MTQRTSKLLESFDQLTDHLARHVSTLVPAVPRPAEDSTRHCYLSLIQKLAQIQRSENQAIVVAFTSVHSGEGVTYVMESLAWELAKHTGRQVLLTTGSALACPPAHLWNENEPIQHRVHRLVEVHGSGQRTLQNLRWQDLRGLRERFGFVLVDCPAMRDSSVVLTVARISDFVVLVVAANQAERREIKIAEQALKASSAKILGVILNKRTDPIPGFVSRFL